MMPLTPRYMVTVVELIYDENKEEDREIKRYEQIVDVVDMGAIIAAVNNPPRARALRSDAGKPKAKRVAEGGFDL